MPFAYQARRRTWLREEYAARAQGDAALAGFGREILFESQGFEGELRTAL